MDCLVLHPTFSLFPLEVCLNLHIIIEETRVQSIAVIYTKVMRLAGKLRLDARFSASQTGVFLLHLHGKQNLVVKDYSM